MYLYLLRAQCGVQIHQRSTGLRLINRTINPHTPPTGTLPYYHTSSSSSSSTSSSSSSSTSLYLSFSKINPRTLPYYHTLSSSSSSAHLRKMTTLTRMKRTSAGVNTLMDVGVRQTPLSHMIEESTFVFLFEHFVFFLARVVSEFLFRHPRCHFSYPFLPKVLILGNNHTNSHRNS